MKYFILLLTATLLYGALYGYALLSALAPVLSALPALKVTS